MIYIFCGEDSSSARSAYKAAIDKYRETQAEILAVPTSSIVDIRKGLAENISLFSTKKIFCVDGLEKHSFRKSTKLKKDAVYEALVWIASDESVILLDFEEGKQARELKLKDIAKVIEAKPSVSIFKLLEECYPTNKLSFLASLHEVGATQEDMFVFVMLFRHIRQLILACDNDLPAKTPPWQKQKMHSQAKRWNKKALMDFYTALIRIEISSKTSANPYGIYRSLQILACHYL